MEAGKKRVVWTRIFCVAVTAGALGIVLSRLDLDALGLAFRTMRPEWFMGAAVLEGLLFLPAAWRWHLVLQLTGGAVRPLATARATLICHFFFTITFGVVGGDAVKT